MRLFRPPAAALPPRVIALLAVVVASSPVESRAQTPEPPTRPPVPAICSATPAPLEIHKGDPHFPSYLDDSFEQLKSAVPALRGLRFEGHPATPEREDESAAILNQTGSVIAGMLPRVPNLIAREELLQVLLPLPYNVSQLQQSNFGGGRRGSPPPTFNSTSRGLEGEELMAALHSSLITTTNRTIFSYRVRSTPDPTYGTILNEYRTNAQNESIGMSSTDPGHPRGVGFSNSWLMFMPDTLQESHFRYLGRQKLGKRDTFVLAFAQRPERVALASQITVDVSCPYFMQGVLWIDQSIFQIVRLETDLLAPLPGIALKQLRSEIRFTEVRIPERRLILWMPSDVEISWELKDQAAAELHKYSNYRLFGATSRIVLPDPE